MKTELPFPEVGEEWMTPYGFDECPVCVTPGLFVSEKPNECMCGAKFGGLSRTELLEVPDRGEQNVIIRAAKDDLEHKVFHIQDCEPGEPYPRQSLAYWRVSGTPQQTGPGRKIMFSEDGDRVDYHAPICTVEEGKIWFAFLSPVDYEVPKEPPTRGFTYVEPTENKEE